MAKTVQFKVINPRNGGKYSLLGADLAIGYKDDSGKFVGILEVKGLWLKEKKDGTGHYVQFPSKQRFDKNGEAVVENGYKVYDNQVDLYSEVGGNPKDPSKKAITSEGWNFRSWLIDELLAASKALGNAPAAAPKASTHEKAAPAPAAVSPKDPYENPPALADDDDLPW